MGSSWKEEMALRQEAADKNECRELIEVPIGSEWQLRRLQMEFPCYLWKFSEGQTVPGYVVTIAKRLEDEFGYTENLPTDLYPYEYFRVLEHSMPTDLALQPKRLDKVKIQLENKLQEYYDTHELEMFITDTHLVPKMACAVLIENVWFRGKLENAPNAGPWLYVNLVDVGRVRQVHKRDIRYLDASFGHYPPLVVKGSVRGARVQRMDIGKVQQFKRTLEDHNFLVRCQITTSTEPFQVNLCHPTDAGDMKNVFEFLITPQRGVPPVDGVWLPKRVAVELERANGVERERDDSGADSDLDDEEEREGWDFEREEGDTQHFIRSFPKISRFNQYLDEELSVEHVENERLIYLSSEEHQYNREAIEGSLDNMVESNTLTPLPEHWLVYGAACCTNHVEGMKRAAITGINGREIELLLVDYGLTTKQDVSNVFSLPQFNHEVEAPFICVVSLAAFPNIHYSRVQILRNILREGIPLKFEKTRGRNSDYPFKGKLTLWNGSSVEELVLEQIAAKRLDLNCTDLVPYQPNSSFRNDPVNNDFVYRYRIPVIYKKSKLVTSMY